MSSQTASHPAKAPAKGASNASSGAYISLMALVMMNVTIIGSVANDVQQAYYGLTSVTLFIIGALIYFMIIRAGGRLSWPPVALSAATSSVVLGKTLGPGPGITWSR